MRCFIAFFGLSERTVPSLICIKNRAKRYRGPRKVLCSKLFGERRNKCSKLKRFAREPFSLAKFVWTSGCPAIHICTANISLCEAQYHCEAISLAAGEFHCVKGTFTLPSLDWWAILKKLPCKKARQFFC